MGSVNTVTKKPDRPSVRCNACQNILLLRMRRRVTINDNFLCTTVYFTLLQKLTFIKVTRMALSCFPKDRASIPALRYNC